MKKSLMIVALVAGFSALVIGADEKHAVGGEMGPGIVKGDAIKWGAQPPGLPAGMQMAVLLGDPGKEGPYVLRAKMPDGYKVPPHWHSADENLTILSGTLLVGHGEKLERATMTELGAGSFCHMPKGMHHYVMAKGETVIQVHGIGPFDITYINPADDPRKEKK